jgi:hypothetical protein
MWNVGPGYQAFDFGGEKFVETRVALNINIELMHPIADIIFKYIFFLI